MWLSEELYLKEATKNRYRNGYSSKPAKSKVSLDHLIVGPVCIYVPPPA